jgi:hypothetical protein
MFMSHTAWHPAFFEAIQLEFEDYRDVLSFESEHQLTAEPLKMDVLIIKKRPGAVIGKNIGMIFRDHNIVEYKSPADYASIDDYNKTCGYSRIYAALQKIDMVDISVTISATKHPRKLLGHLEKRYRVTKRQNGIYLVDGETCPTQIIVSEELAEEKNLWVKSLNEELTIAGAERIIAETDIRGKDTSFGAYLDVIIKTNSQTFFELQERKMNKHLEEYLITSGFAAKYGVHEKAEGKVEGKADAVITVLKTRLGSVPSDVQESIKSYSDLTALEPLLQSAVTCGSINEFRQNLVR